MFRFLMLFTPMILMANDTDIVPRTIHFFIFVALMYYLLANPVKNFYFSRINSISNKLKSVEDSLEKAKMDKELAIKKIEKANKEAEELIQLAKVQADKLSEQIIKNADEEIKNMEKLYLEQKAFEEKKAKVEVISELTDELLHSKINFKQDKLLEVISRKVS